MIFKSQSMRQIMQAMQETIEAWERTPEDERDMQINPDAPVVIQCGDYGYEVQSVGGDGDCEGFVIMVKENPVCEWISPGEFVRFDE